MSRRHDGYSELLGAYASGTLEPAFSLLVETQAALRDDLSLSVACSETMSGDFLEREDPSPLSSDARARCLAAIDALEGAAAGDESTIPDAWRGELDTLPEPVRSHAVEAAAKADWRKLMNGVSCLDLPVGGVEDVELYRIEPGRAIPRHTHGDLEYTLVLCGSFSDDTGRYGPGDLTVKTPDDTHQPIAGPDAVCYALAVSRGGQRLTGILGLVQRLIGR